jgi:replication factor C small subunit
VTELNQVLWTEKYRPASFDDLVSADKSILKGYLDRPLEMPSLIFYSSKPGTGKTSTSKLFSQVLQCDTLVINSSDERGIETIREKIITFARGMSSNPLVKRCIRMEEADGLTRQAQDSLRNLMEEYSDNCFFIFTANDISKIIEPIRSRCQIVSFERPLKSSIFGRLDYICQSESVTIPDDQLHALVDRMYPDMRRMINWLQMRQVNPQIQLVDDVQSYEQYLAAMKSKDFVQMATIVYSGQFDCMGFNSWMFSQLWAKYKPENFDRCRQLAVLLADTEKAYNQGVNLEPVFLANCLEMCKVI